MNDRVINILREYNQELSERVKERRFYQHDKEWVESMEEYEKNVMGSVDDGYQKPGYAHNEQDFENGELNDAQIDPRMWDDSEEDD